LIELGWVSFGKTLSQTPVAVKRVALLPLTSGNKLRGREHVCPNWVFVMAAVVEATVAILPNPTQRVGNERAVKVVELPG